MLTLFEIPDGKFILTNEPVKEGSMVVCSGQIFNVKNYDNDKNKWVCEHIKHGGDLLIMEEHLTVVKQNK